MLRKKTSAIKYNKNYVPKVEFMRGEGVVGSGEGCYTRLLESDGYVCSTSPGGKLATASEEKPKMIQKI